MKIYSNYGNAKKAANGRQMIRIGLHSYVVGNVDDLTEISILNENGVHVGHVSVGHLKRLGNANWATPKKDSPRVCPVCQDGACETKPLDCGK